MLNTMFDMVAAGSFPSSDACAFCDFPEICGGKVAVERFEAKLAKPENDQPGLAAWRRLRDVR